MSGVVTKALHLKNYGEGVLSRLHYARHRCHRRSDATLPKNKDYGNIIQKIIKVFPNEPESKDLEKMSGFDQFKAKDSAIRDELEPIYHAILAVVDYRDAVEDLLAELPSISCLTLDVSPMAIDAIMSSISFYVCILMVLHECLSSDFKEAVAVYARAYKNMQHRSLHDLERVVQMLLHVGKQKYIVQALPELFENDNRVATLVGNTLRHLGVVYQNLQLANVRRDGLLDPLHTQDLAVLPLPTDTYRDHLIKDKLETWILCGFMVCPGQLAVGNSLEILKMILSQTFQMKAFRNNSVDVHELYKIVFDSYGTSRKDAKINLGKKKNKEQLVEAATAAVCQAPIARAERRAYLLEQISKLLSTLEDCPGMLGPKAELALCCLSMVRQEVDWYLKHNTRVENPPQWHKVSKRWREELFKDDAGIADLIHYSVSLTNLMQKHENVVRTYYVSFLKGLDKQQLDAFVSKEKVPGNVKTRLEEMQKLVSEIDADAIEKIKPGTPLDQIPSLDRIRVIANAVQGMVAGSAGGDVDNPKKLAAVLASIVSHSRLVDDWYGLMRNHVSLGELFFHYPQLKVILNAILSGRNERPEACISLVRSCGQLGYHYHPHCPEEQHVRGEYSAVASQSFMTIITRYMNDAFNQMVIQQHKLEVGQADPIRNMTRRQNRRELVPPQHQGNERQHSELPGAESQVDRRIVAPIKQWADQHHVLFQILGEIERVPVVTVYNRTFNLKEHVRIVIHDRVFSTLRSKVPEQQPTKVPPIPRPSEYLAHFRILMSVCHVWCSYVSINYVEEINKRVLGEVFTTRAVGFGMPGQAPRNVVPPLNTPIIHMLGDWLEHVIKHNLSNVVVSGWRNSLVTLAEKPGESKLELYFDPNELRDLVTILGPYGASYLDSKLRLMIQDHVESIQDALKRCREPLQEIKAHYYNREKINLWSRGRSVARELDIDRRVREIGKIDAVRSMILDELEEVASERIPFVVNLANVMRSSYFESGAREREVEPSAYLALAVGDRGPSTVDVPLARQLLALIDQEDNVWPLFPVAMAVSAASDLWRRSDTRFSTQLDGFLNNAHCIARGMEILISTFRDPPAAVAPDDPTCTSDEEKAWFEEYLRIASFIVLSKPKEDSEYKLKEIYAFLDKVMQLKAFTNVVTDDLFPFTLVRSTLNEFHKRQDTLTFHETADGGNDDMYTTTGDS